MAALDAGSGKVLWRTGYPAPFTMDKSAAPHGPGPEGHAGVFADNKLFSIGMSGHRHRIRRGHRQATLAEGRAPGKHARSGRRTRSRRSLDRGLVVVHVGGNDKGAADGVRRCHTGEVKWAWRRRRPRAMGSPIRRRLWAGSRQIVTMTQQKFVGVGCRDRRAPRGSSPYTTEYAQNIVTPVQVRQIRSIVSGYQKPVAAFRRRRS